MLRKSPIDHKTDVWQKKTPATNHFDVTIFRIKNLIIWGGKSGY